MWQHPLLHPGSALCRQPGDTRLSSMRGRSVNQSSTTSEPSSPPSASSRPSPPNAMHFIAPRPPSSSALFSAAGHPCRLVGLGSPSRPPSCAFVSALCMHTHHALLPAVGHTGQIARTAPSLCQWPGAEQRPSCLLPREGAYGGAACMDSLPMCQKGRQGIAYLSR